MRMGMAAGWRALLMGIVAVSYSGCGGSPQEDVDVPFSEGGVSGLPRSGGSATGVRGILFLAPAEPDDQVKLWELATQERAGLRKLLMMASTYESGGEPDSLAQAIAGAGDRGASVILLVPPPEVKSAAELEQAIEKASREGVKIITVGRPMPELKVINQVSQVLLPSQEQQARAAVEGAMKKAGQRPQFGIAQGPALILTNTGSSGPWVAERVKGFRAELEKQGIPVSEEMGVKAPGDPATKALREKLSAEGGPKLVFAADYWTLKAATSARLGLVQPESVVVAGFADDTGAFELVSEGSIDALVESNLVVVAGQAMAMAEVSMQGRKVAERVDLSAPVRLSEKLPKARAGPAREVQEKNAAGVK